MKYLLSFLLGSLLLANIAYSDAFSETEGATLYKMICASCHMPDGKGAEGAGTYPSFVNNAKIENKSYPQIVVLYGLNGMPAFGGVLDNSQISNVINYVRTNFGGYQDGPITAEEVAMLRIPDYEYNDLN